MKHTIKCCEPGGDPRSFTEEWDDESEYRVTLRKWSFPAGFRSFEREWTPDEYLTIDPLKKEARDVVYPDGCLYAICPDIFENRDYPGVIKETGEEIVIHCAVIYDAYGIVSSFDDENRGVVGPHYL